MFIEHPCLKVSWLGKNSMYNHGHLPYISESFSLHGPLYILWFQRIMFIKHVPTVLEIWLGGQNCIGTVI